VTQPVRILVLCTGNSSRSILAEALFRDLGGPRVAVESAGSDPAGAVNPLAAAVLDEAGIDHGWARSKSMSAFLDRPFDHVITVCIPDPAKAIGGEEERLAVYRATYADLRQRISGFLATLET
jgi:protein-tyrosine-phosphatase